MNQKRNNLVPVWQPGVEQLTRSHMARFAARYCQLKPGDYAELLQWSLDDPARFWGAVWDYCEVSGDKGSLPWVVEANNLWEYQWFPDARLNYAENLLKPGDNNPALIFRSESLDRRVVTHDQLYAQVARCAHFLRHQGVEPGDCVAGFMPNCIETVIAMLAATSLGACWCSCSPDFGLDGVYDRFSQVRPKVIFSVDGYIWKGKPIPIHEKVEALAVQLKADGCLKALVEAPFIALERDAPAAAGAIPFSRAMENSAQKIVFEQVDFNHPLFVMFTSGTTGLPKCIIHRTGGVLLQLMKEHRLHCDIHDGDRVFFYTTCGWMMWNWLISALASNAALVLFDGSPFHPHPGVLWEIAEDEGVTFFGAGAKYLQAVEKAGVKVGEDYDISSLRTIASTGSPLVEESYDYVYQQISPNVHLASISGGTDLISCFVLGNPCLPVYRGEIQCAGLGLHVDVVGDDNVTLRQGKGELVCRNAFPCMPLGFGNDPDGSKYHAAYFDARPGLWSHSDFAEQRIHASYTSYVIHGRFDSTLNPGGVRIGTAEIYRQVEKLPLITESVVVGQNTGDGDVRVLLFVIMTEGEQLTEDIKTRLCKAIRTNTTPRHVPDFIIQVSDIPRTRNGKIAELAVRDVINGEEVKNTQALANPESLALFADLKELK